MSTVAQARPLRVLHVINGEYFAGAERVEDLLAMSLPEFGVEIEFVTLKQGLFPTKRQSGVRIHPIHMDHRLDIGVVRRVTRLVREGRFDLIHSHTPRAAVLSAMVSGIARVPFVHHVHSPVSRDSERAIANKLNAAAEFVALKQADALVCVSQSLHREYRERYLSRGISTIAYVPNGVKVNERMRGPRAMQPVIGMVALFRPRKGLEIALLALRAIRSRWPDVRFRAIGPFVSSEYEREIMNLVSSLGLSDCTDWSGFADDVTRELSAIDVALIPSLYGEGLPMVLLEAAASGVPVIASRVEGIPEVISHGETGLIVEPGDVDSLANAIEYALREPVEMERMAALARRHQRERYSDQSMSRSLAQVYRDLHEKAS